MVKEVLRKMRNEKRNPWIRRLNLYLKKIGISFDQMVRMKKRQIVRKILKYDSIRWYDNLLTKTLLGIYRRVIFKEIYYTFTKNFIEHNFFPLKSYKKM